MASEVVSSEVVVPVLGAVAGATAATAAAADATSAAATARGAAVTALSEGAMALRAPEASTLATGYPPTSTATAGVIANERGVIQIRTGTTDVTDKPAVAELATQCSSAKVIPGVDAAVQAVVGMNLAESQTVEISGAGFCADLKMLDKATSFALSDVPRTESAVGPCNIQTKTRELPDIDRVLHDKANILQLTCEILKLLTFVSPKLLTYTQPLLLTYPAADTTVSSDLPFVLNTIDTDFGLFGMGNFSSTFETDFVGRNASLPDAHCTATFLLLQCAFEARADALRQYIQVAKNQCDRHMETISFFQSKPYPATSCVGLAPNFVAGCSSYLDRVSSAGVTN